MKSIKRKFIIFLSLIIISIFSISFFNKLKIIQQNSLIEMPKETKRHWGKIPIFEQFDTQTFITASWFFRQDEQGNIIDYQGYIYDKELKKIKGLYYSFNRGNFKKGYMYGVDEEGNSKKIWQE